MQQHENTQRAPSELAGQYLTCWLGDECYGLGTLGVREIIGILPITPMPHTEDHVLGVINLRGRVIPVVDLRLRFGLPAAEPTETTCIIVAEVHAETETRVCGVVVDRVSEVCHITENEIVEAPRYSEGPDADFLLGMGKHADDLVFLLDVEEVLEDTDHQNPHSELSLAQ